MLGGVVLSVFFFFNDTATTEIYTLSLHDALPISSAGSWSTTCSMASGVTRASRSRLITRSTTSCATRSEEHTSELQSLAYLVCRLLLEKKKTSRGPALARKLTRLNSSP